LKIKLKCRHFDTIEAIEVESQAVLNTLPEHEFQDEFKKITEVLGTVHTLVRVMVAGGLKLVSDQMEAQVPEIIDGSL
jgi:predicted helicase